MLMKLLTIENFAKKNLWDMHLDFFSMKARTCLLIDYRDDILKGFCYKN